MNEIVRSLEEEKIARNSIQSTLIKLKEDFARSELEKDKMIIELQTKYDKARIEKQQIELEINKQKEAHIRSEQVNQNKIATLEDQLSRALSMYAELDESSKIVIDKLKKENGSSNSEVAKKYEQSLRKKDESIRSLTTEVDSLLSQISTLKTDLLSRKADEELRLNEVMKELGQLQRQFHDSLSAEQEDKLRMSQAHSERLNKLQFDHNKDLEAVK